MGENSKVVTLFGTDLEVGADYLAFLARLSTFAPTANFFRRETPRDAAVGRESPQIAVAKAV